MIARAVLVCLALVGVSGADPSPKQVFTTIAPSSVRLRRDRNSKHPGAGSGTIIEAHDGGALVLTCAHVVEGESAVLVDLDEENRPIRTLPGLVVKRDEDHDLALVQVLGTTKRPARPIASVEPDLYDDLYVVSAPNRIMRQSAVERLNTKDDASADSQYFRGVRWTVTGQVIPGMSGSAMTNAEGEIVCITQAVASWGDDEIMQMGYAVPLRFIRAFLKGVQAGPQHTQVLP
jgi:S1-C subfamily serine protease